MRQDYKRIGLPFWGSFILFMAFMAIGKLSYATDLKPHYRMSIDSPPVVVSDSVNTPSKLKSPRERYIDVSLEYGSNFTYRN